MIAMLPNCLCKFFYANAPETVLFYFLLAPVSHEKDAKLPKCVNMQISYLNNSAPGRHRPAGATISCFNTFENFMETILRNKGWIIFHTYSKE